MKKLMIFVLFLGSISLQAAQAPGGPVIPSLDPELKKNLLNAYHAYHDAEKKYDVTMDALRSEPGYDVFKALDSLRGRKALQILDNTKDAFLEAIKNILKSSGMVSSSNLENRQALSHFSIDVERNIEGNNDYRVRSATEDFQGIISKHHNILTKDEINYLERGIYLLNNFNVDSPASEYAELYNFSYNSEIHTA